MEPDAARDWFARRGLLCATLPSITDAVDFEPTIRLFGPVTILGGTIGAYSYVSPKTAMVRTTIGRYCSIGDRCTLGPTQHPTDWLTTSPISYTDVFDLEGAGRSESHDELTPVWIGNDVWIGSNASVMGGVKIGDGAIIAYGSVVTRDVAPYTIVGGVPARPIRARFAPEIVAELEAAQWWQWDLVRLRGTPIAWRDPLRALDDLASKAETGEVDPIPSAFHRITRKGPDSFGFTKLR